MGEGDRATLIERAWRGWLAVRFRIRVVFVLALIYAPAALVVIGVRRGSERAGVVALMVVAGLTELAAVWFVITDFLRRRKAVTGYVPHIRTPVPSPRISPRRAERTVHRYFVPRNDTDRLNERIDGIEAMVRATVGDVNGAMERVATAAGRNDKRLERLVLDLFVVERGWTRVGVALFVWGVVLGSIANVWSMFI